MISLLPRGKDQRVVKVAAISDKLKVKDNKMTNKMICTLNVV